MRPLPSGSASFHVEAGLLYHSLRGFCFACAKQQKVIKRKNILSKKDLFMNDTVSMF